MISPLLVAASAAVVALHPPLDVRDELAVPPRPEVGSGEVDRPLAARELALVENAGQWPADVLFAAAFAGAWVRVEADALSFELPAEEGCPALVRLRFEGASPSARAEGEALREGLRHYLVGERERWRRGVRAFGAVQIRELRPGVDLRVREGGGLVEYDLLLAPAADLGSVVVRAEGCESLRLAPDGALVMETPAGQLLQQRPVAWEVDEAGERRDVPCRFRLHGGNRFGFEVEGRAEDRPLVVDPPLEWSTFLGGSSWESAYAVAIGPDGSATVVGQTGSSNFPTTPGAFDTSYNGVAFSDVFVTRLAADGTLLWSTFVGGFQGETAQAVAVDGGGRATVVGSTASSGFPTTPGAFDSQLGGSSDLFVLRLDASGSVLESSTLLGGSSGEAAGGVVVDDAGVASLVATTDSSDFPTTAGAFDTQLDGSSDAVFARVSADGSALLHATYLGGSSGDTGMGIAAAPGGDFVLTGVTSSPDFPVTANAFDTQLDGNSDAWVTRVSPAGALVSSTLLGGSGGDTGEAVAVDAHGAVTVAGVTSSADFPTTPGAYDGTLDGTSDAFVARISADGSALLSATLLGGSSGDVAKAVAVDASGAATVAGVTSSSDFPTTPSAFDPTSAGSSDAFVARISPDGSKLVHATYLGGSGGDVGEAMDACVLGFAVVGGTTSSSDFPVSPGAADPTYGSPSEAFASRLSMLPFGVERYGSSTPACLGPISVAIDAAPVAGGPPFTFTCTAAPPASLGVLAVGLAPDVAGTPLAGIVLHVSLFAPIAFLNAQSDSTGWSQVPLALTSSASGISLHAQFGWLGTPACGGTGALFASDAISVSVP